MTILNGQTHKPIDIVIAIHNLRLPTELSNIIVKYAVPIMSCSVCNKTIQKDYRRTKNLGWIALFDDSKGIGSIKCINCTPSLQTLYKNRHRVIIAIGND